MNPNGQPTHASGHAKGINLVSRARPFFGLILLITLLLTAIGVVSMFAMPSGIYPEVAFPRIVVIAQTQGMAVKDVEVGVTRPIEEAVSIVLGVVRVQSKSLRGASEINIDFAPDSDMVQALNDVRARMAEVGSQLPPGTSTLTERQTPSEFPIISFVVTGIKDQSRLYDYAYYDLKPRISRINDVSLVTVQGGDIREVVVEVDPSALAGAGLAISDVADLLTKQHRMKAAGRIDRESLQYQVLIDTLATDPMELENRVVVEKNGQAIRVKDIGRVLITHQDRTVAIRSNAQDAVALTVFRRLGGNALAVSRDLKSVLAEAASSAPVGIKIRPVYDQGELVRTAIANVRDAIIVGGLFSVVILLLFLKSVRATLIASLSIPISLIVSFVFLYLIGDTLNLMSLGGLAVAIGLIIDDTVVVIENIARRLSQGETGDVSIERASREITGAVVGSTLTTILVFVPLAFVKGVVGQFFQSLSVALSTALLVSMVVSLTIIPVLASRFLAKNPMPAPGPIYNFLASRYEGVLRGALRVPLLVLAAAVLVVAPGYLLSQKLESGFMPDMDEGAFVLDYEMPVGTSLAETDRVLRRVERILDKTEDVSGYIRRTGAELGFFATESYTGDILVSLKPPGKRRPLHEIFESIRGALDKEAPELKHELIALIQDQLNDLGGLEAVVEVKVFGPDHAVLRDLAEKVGARMEKVAGLAEVDTHVQLGNPDIVIHPDSVQTSRVGLTVQDIENQVNAALYGQVVSTLPEQDRLTKIRLRYSDAVRYDREHLGRLPIGIPSTNATPGMRFVPLAQLATIEVVRSPNELTRENQQPFINVTAELEGRDLGAVNVDLEKALKDLKFPKGYRWELAGNFRSKAEAFRSLAIVLVVAAFLVYLLLAFQFRSLLLPLPIFLTQPLSLASAVFALWVTGTPLNVSSFMGAILLIGLDVKNGIILIEYIGQLESEGLPRRQALIQAGRTRFRPILMTSLCTIFGLAPLALGIGPGAQMQQPLAIAVIGGLIMNMLITRLLIPVFYLLFMGDAKSASPVRKEPAPEAELVQA